MNILQIGGLRMHLESQGQNAQGYWALADLLQVMGHHVVKRECLQNNDANQATGADVVWADAIIDFSYGGATEKQLIHRTYDNLRAIGKRFKLVVSIAKVPDVLLGQDGGLFGFLWHVEDFIEKALFFNIDVFPPGPVSYPIRGGGERVWNCTIGELLTGSGAAAGAGRLVNVDCNGLVAGRDWVSMHTSVCDEQAIVGPQGAIVKAFQLMGNGTPNSS